MKAPVLREYGAPLDVSTVADPRLRDGDALVAVRAVGLCGTDLKLISGVLERNRRLPLVPGHEVAGEVVRSVHGLPAGQRVACYVYDSCGSCRWCRAEQETLCLDTERIGIERNGGLAELIAVPAVALLPFGKQLSFSAAAVAMDAVAASALHLHARVLPGETVAIVGIGGLGTNAVQIAQHMGARGWPRSTSTPTTEHWLSGSATSSQ